MPYNDELIIRYESLFGNYNNYFDKPAEITPQSVKLHFSNKTQIIGFVRSFLKDFRLCKLTNNGKTIEIKLLNLYNLEKLLKDILNSLKESLPRSVVTVNRNCYYGR
ncbi:MAG: hypothetical protein GF329_04070 [Candidatus Lokiarchaeota archaeon]|nr:hypothetical protein [Candidatus Lokiarchaeota archaeon]